MGRRHKRDFRYEPLNFGYDYDDEEEEEARSLARELGPPATRRGGACLRGCFIIASVLALLCGLGSVLLFTSVIDAPEGLEDMLGFDDDGDAANKTTSYVNDTIEATTPSTFNTTTVEALQGEEAAHYSKYKGHHNKHRFPHHGHHKDKDDSGEEDEEGAASQADSPVVTTPKTMPEKEITTTTADARNVAPSTTSNQDDSATSSTNRRREAEGYVDERGWPMESQALHEVNRWNWDWNDLNLAGLNEDEGADLYSKWDEIGALLGDEEREDEELEETPLALKIKQRQQERAESRAHMNVPVTEAQEAEDENDESSEEEVEVESPAESTTAKVELSDQVNDTKITTTARPSNEQEATTTTASTSGVTLTDYLVSK